MPRPVGQPGETTALLTQWLLSSPTITFAEAHTLAQSGKKPKQPPRDYQGRGRSLARRKVMRLRR